MASVQIRRLIAEHLPSLVALRHDLHAHPELSFKERRTSEVVARELQSLKIKVKTGFGNGTGVLGYLPASTPEGNARPAVAFRADMDALPIVEATGKPYASCTPGVMHACGHDGHTTILIGLARVLSAVHRPSPVTLIFQPAEEWGGGANVMCREGCLAGEIGGGLGNPVGSVFGLHGWPTVTLGRVGSRPGPLLAATDDFTITIRGTQSHGAYPHFGHDPIVAAAHVITAMQTIASRNVSPLDSVVVTVGAINAGTANNIIPQEVTFIGTVRTLDPQTRSLARERLHAVAEGVAASMGCRAHVQYEEGYPVTINDPRLVASFMQSAARAFGAERVEHIEEPTMGGEDFSYYGHHVPACFFFLGLKPHESSSYPTLHQPDFDFNDEALPVGIEMMASLALGL